MYNYHVYYYYYYIIIIVVVVVVVLESCILSPNAQQAHTTLRDYFDLIGGKFSSAVALLIVVGVLIFIIAAFGCIWLPVVMQG